MNSYDLNIAGVATMAEKWKRKLWDFCSSTDLPIDHFVCVIETVDEDNDVVDVEFHDMHVDDLIGSGITWVYLDPTEIMHTL